MSRHHINVSLAVCRLSGDKSARTKERDPMRAVTLEAGDCLDVMLEMAAREEVFDALITDPPYHLSSVVKRFGGDNAAPAKHGTDGLYARASAGFMGKRWDGGDVAFRPETWLRAYDVLKPGAYLAAFGGTRTYHRMACAIEDAGFEIRDCLMWLYGTGFPKSHNEGDGRGTALKPAWEPIVLARKPVSGTIAANILQFGTGAMNIDACRIPGVKPDTTRGAGGQHGSFRPIAAQGRILDDGLGRWPANVLHDGSDEVEAAFAAFGDKTSGKPGIMRKGRNDGACYGAESRRPGTPMTGFGDSGTASRFFYCAKATKADRSGSKHPTVKPQALMRWLCKLLTPPGGVILDPFCGSGSTLQAAFDCGFGAVAIEREPEYQNDIARRIESMEAEFQALLAS